LLDVFSNDVLIASAVEQTGRPNQVHVSLVTFLKVKNHCTFDEGPRISLFGKEIPTYFVLEMKDSTKPILKTVAASPIEEKKMHSAQSVQSSQLSLSNRPRTASTPAQTISSNKGTLIKPGVSMETSLKESPVDAERAKGDSESPDFLLRLTENDKDLHFFSCRFVDPYLEQDYQENYVARCQGKMSFAMIATIIVTALLNILDYIVVLPFTPSSIALFFFSHLISVIFQVPFLFIAFSKFVPEKSLGNSRLSKWLKDHLADAVKLGKNINYQYVGPTLLVVVFITRLFHLDRVYLRENYFYSEMYTLMILATLWTRLSALYLSATLFFITAIMLAIVQIEKDFAYVIGYQIAVLVAAYFVMRRMEKNIRRNFILKRSLAQKQFEIEDIRLKSERLLFKLLPRAVVNQLKMRSLNAAGGEIAELVESAGIMFCTICHFKEVNAGSMTILNDIICRFDNMLALYEIEKIKTIGKSFTHLTHTTIGIFQLHMLTQINIFVGPIYMCCSGLARVFEEKQPDEPVDTSHVFNLADFALAVRAKLASLNKDYPKEYHVRIGLEVGPIVV
jgi:hypothetical protein